MTSVMSPQSALAMYLCMYLCVVHGVSGMFVWVGHCRGLYFTSINWLPLRAVCVGMCMFVLVCMCLSSDLTLPYLTSLHAYMRM